MRWASHEGQLTGRDGGEEKSETNEKGENKEVTSGGKTVGESRKG